MPAGTQPAGPGMGPSSADTAESWATETQLPHLETEDGKAVRVYLEVLREQGRHTLSP